ncbi:MAG TPA: tripartite tricarboxylate transporter substrate binding protein [Burkholderiales bacterium]|nr:tripartite tricarboxylate transporter substrate binding protein [Burkholderiales bacterium]
MPQQPRSKRRSIARAVSCLIASHLAITLAAAADTGAERFPVKPIRFIMPYPVGGSIDLGGRTAAQQAAENMGQQIVIDNRTGAGGTLGAELGARAAPDGYTIVMGGTGTLAISPSMNRRLGYDVARDFAPITLLATTPYVLAVPPSLPAKSIKELIALAKSQPGRIIYASDDSGSAPHLIGEMFRTRSGADFLHVPYKGSTPAKIDLMAGRVQMFFTGVPSIISELKVGTLRALGVTSAKRSASLPDVPSIAESGLPGFDVSPWFGVLAPARTPPAIVARLNAEFVSALQTPGVRDTMLRNGFDSVGNSPQAFTAFITSERTQWAEAIRASGAKVE